MDKNISSLAHQAIASRLFPGCQIGVITNNKLKIFCFGTTTYDTTSSPVTEDTVYDVASLTKSVPTALIALMLLDKKIVNLSDPINRYIPELKGKYSEIITVHHLLTQTVTFPFTLSAEKDKTASEIRELILSSDLVTPPGTQFTYTNASSILLGWVIEIVGGRSLEQLAREWLFEPLGMTATGFSPEKQRCAPTEENPHRGLIQGVVHDESAYILGEKGFVGSAGLFSTAGDLLACLEGVLHEKKVISAKMIGSMATNQPSHLGVSHGLGWELNQQWFMGKKSSKNTIGKTGFTGCSMAYDLEKAKGAVILSNTIYPKRPDTRKEINAFRSTIADIVFTELP